jgi:hypothetical protein
MDLIKNIMKKVTFPGLIMLTVISLSFFSCTTDKDSEMDKLKKINIDTLTFVHSMKGWELYSWPNRDDWNYSILVGTNRIKSYSEVTTNKIIVSGKDSLKMLLDKFPENENIFWKGKGWLERCWGGNYGNLSLPDNKTINEIKEYCLQKKLILNISE